MQQRSMDEEIESYQNVEQGGIRMSIAAIEQETAGIKKQAKELIEQAYLRGYKAGQENALAVDSDKFREQGRNEAWEAARKLFLNEENGGLKQEDFVSLFDGKRPVMVLAYKSASEVIAKIKAYEEQKQKEADEIHVGDEVIPTYGVTEPFIAIAVDNDAVYGFDINGNYRGASKSETDFKKTGRHFDEIAEVLKKMKEGN